MRRRCTSIEPPARVRAASWRVPAILVAAACVALTTGIAQAQDAAPAPDAAAAEDTRAPPQLPVFVDSQTIRKPNGMIVRYYRCDAVDPDLLRAELERWKTEKASIIAVGPMFAAGVEKNSIVRQNTLRIEETAENWPILDGVLAMVDAPQPQVYVDAKIVEVSFNDDLRVGIGPSNVRTDRPVGDLFFKRVDAVFGNALGSTDNSAISFGSDDKFVKFDYILQLGKSGAHADIKSEPRILATQGETATIKVGEQEPIVKQNINGSNVTATTDFKDVGLLLEVQPLMIGREIVRARLSARVSRVSDFRVTSTSNDRDVVNPVISEREASSVIEVMNGDTVVISGLQQTQKFDQRRGIPLLMDIPGLGYLFGSTTKQEIKTELVFFVTFTIVRPGENRVVVPPAEIRRTEKRAVGE